MSLPRRLLDQIRARPGAASVQFTPDAVRGGNILYYWQWAFAKHHGRPARRVLHTPHMDPWLREFPALESLTVYRSQVGLFDHRAFATRHHFGSSFSANDVRSFTQWLLDTSHSFRTRVDTAKQSVNDRTCVVNVRRGDYYSVSQFESEFGMDIQQHVTQAMELIASTNRQVEEVLIVSDDPEWCKHNLTTILPYDMRFVENKRDLFDDLAVLAASKTLVLANSTFSYWGSFFAKTIDDNHFAIAPPLHQRLQDGTAITDLFDPSWPRTEL